MPFQSWVTKDRLALLRGETPKTRSHYVKVQRSDDQFDNRSLAIKALYIMLTRYQALPIEIWDLCTDLSDPREQRTLRTRRLDHGWSYISDFALEWMLSIQRFEIAGIRLDEHFIRKLPSIPANLKMIVTGEMYNHPFILPSKVESVELGAEFDQPIDFPASLRQLTIHGEYTHPLHLPEGLIEANLLLKNTYQHAPILLPSTLKKLDFHLDMALSRDLPPKLESLVWGNLFSMGPLPYTLQKLMIMDENFNQPLELAHLSNLLILDLRATSYNFPLTLPEGLLELYLPITYTHPLNMPSSLQIAKLHMDVNYDWVHPIHLPCALREVHIDPHAMVTLPNTLIKATFGKDYNKPLLFPAGMKELSILAGCYSMPVHLPDTLERLTWLSGSRVDLPDGLLEVEFGEYYDQPIDIPNSLKKVTLKNPNYSHEIHLPVGMLLDFNGLKVRGGEKKKAIVYDSDDGRGVYQGCAEQPDSDCSSEDS